ncbi:hypothetical protein [Streptomyces sp. 900105755]
MDAYVITRPLGASHADRMAVGHGRGRLGLGLRRGYEWVDRQLAGLSCR